MKTAKPWVSHCASITIAISCAAAALFPASRASAAVEYTILDLGTLGGSTSYGTGINDAGQVAGYADKKFNQGSDAFRTAPNAVINSTTSDLGTLGSGQVSLARAINASGQVVGQSFIDSDDTTYHAYRTTGAGVINAAGDLGTLGGNNSDAYGINASGQVVGESEVTVGSFAVHAFRTAANSPIQRSDDLGTLGGSQAGADGINASGQTVGFSYLADNTTFHAFRTAATGKISDSGTDLGTLGGDNSFAYAINDSGQVVGWAETAGNVTQDAFRTSADGAVTAASDLSTLGGTTSEALAINAIGQTVGYSLTNENRSQDAFFVDVTGAMQDLNSLIAPGSGWQLTEADGINNSGQITGYGTINGLPNAFLLTPIPVPEPTGAALLGCIAILLVLPRPHKKILLLPPPQRFCYESRATSGIFASHRRAPEGEPYLREEANVLTGKMRGGRRRARGVSILSLAVLSVLKPATLVADTVWKGTSGDWFSLANWSVEVPTDIDNADIDNGGTAQIASGNAIAGTLFMGDTKSESGTVNLSGGTFFANNSEYIGNLGTGTFLQLSNTTNSASNDIRVGYGKGSQGEYDQDGGTVFAPTLYVGYTAGASGTYYLYAGALSIGSAEVIGNSGTGTFFQYGGDDDNNLEVILGDAKGSDGTYNLNGGTIETPDLYLGYNTGATGSFTLAPTATLTVSDTAYVGRNGTGTFTQTGGTASVANTLYVGQDNMSVGNYTLSAGTVQTTTFIIGDQFGATGNVSLSGTGSMNVTGTAYLGNYGVGTFTQSGGTQAITGRLYIGTNFAASGSYSLSGGTLTDQTSEYVGNAGVGAFVQTGGSNTCQGNLYMGQAVASTGTYPLSAGALTISDNEYVGFAGNGSIIQSGGTNTVLSSTGSINIGDEAGSNGSFTLSGGTLSAGTEYVGFSGNGSFTQSGGVNNTNALVIANAAPGNFTQTGGTLTVAGQITTVTPNGTLTLSGGTATASAVSNIGQVVITGPIGSNSYGNLTVNGNFTQNAGRTEVDGLLTIVNGGAMTLSHSMLTGDGIITGFVNNLSGTVNPGEATGELGIEGQYAQAAAATLEIQISGYLTSFQQDLLTIGGSASLGGTLDVAFANGFTPLPGSTFTVLTVSDGMTGQFANVESSYPLTVNYNLGNVTVTVVPEPVGLTMLAGGAVLLKRRRRK